VRPYGSPVSGLHAIGHDAPCPAGRYHVSQRRALSLGSGLLNSVSTASVRARGLAAAPAAWPLSLVKCVFLLGRSRSQARLPFDFPGSI